MEEIFKILIKFNSKTEGMNYIANYNNFIIFKANGKLYNPDGSTNTDELVFEEEYNYGEIAANYSLPTAKTLLPGNLYIANNIIKYFKEI